MEYRISDTIFQHFPDYRRGVVVATGVDNQTARPELAELLSQEVRGVATDSDAVNDSRVTVWDTAYQKFGANPKRDTPSIRHLIQQIRKGKPPRSINPLVDAFNIISLRYRMPCGGDDLDSLQGGSIRLDVAAGNELFSPLFRADAVEHPAPGEVIYLTPETRRVMCRRWNWRNADFSKIRPETSRVAINLDAMVPPLSAEEARKAGEDLVALLAGFCSGEVSFRILDPATPAFTESKMK